MRRTVLGLMALVLMSTGAMAKGSLIRLKLTYDNRVQLPIISIGSTDELDFYFDPKTRNVSVYYPNNGQMKFIGDKKTGYGYYFGKVALRVETRAGVIDLYGSYKTHITHTRVVTDGKSSCSATIHTELKPGFTTYEYDEPGYGPVTVLSTSQSNIRCELSTVDSI